MGLILASLPATRTWERADQALLDLYASEIGVAIRNAELFTQVQDQNVQLRQLSEVKDDFLRGVSHNLQTPLTSIKSNAEALAASDRRAGRAADGHLGPGRSADADGPAAAARQPARVAAAPADRRRPRHRAADPAGLGRAGRRGPDDGRCVDDAPDWLAVADGDQLDQVLWALLDNAVKYGDGTVDVAIGVEPEARSLWTTITDHGRGLDDSDRAWLFGRFERGVAGRTSGNGSGLGLYVSRALMRGMGGDLVLDPAVAGRGASFRLTLPGEPADEG